MGVCCCLAPASALLTQDAVLGSDRHIVRFLLSHSFCIPEEEAAAALQIANAQAAKGLGAIAEAAISAGSKQLFRPAVPSDTCHPRKTCRAWGAVVWYYTIAVGIASGMRPSVSAVSAPACPDRVSTFSQVLHLAIVILRAGDYAARLAPSEAGRESALKCCPQQVELYWHEALRDQESAAVALLEAVPDARTFGRAFMDALTRYREAVQALVASMNPSQQVRARCADIPV